MTESCEKWTAVNSQGYEAPAGISTDSVVFSWIDNKLQLLLTKRDNSPFKDKWALPGGFLGAKETPLDTAKRKLFEKTGVKTAYLEQLSTYGEFDRDPRGWIPAIAYIALLPQPKTISENAFWQDVYKIDKNQMAFDHAKMIRDALSRLRGKLWYSNVAVGLLEQEFTLSQAREVYQAIADVEYDPANFRRDLQASGLIQSVNKISTSGRGRPASLYSFVSQKPWWVPAKGTK